MLFPSCLYEGKHLECSNSSCGAVQMFIPPDIYIYPKNKTTTHCCPANSRWVCVHEYLFVVIRKNWKFPPLTCEGECRVSKTTAGEENGVGHSITVHWRRHTRFTSPQIKAH